jgi:hypothetical protein
MTSLIFLLTVLTLFVLFIRTLIKLVRRKPVRRTLATIGLVIAGYSLVWTVFKLTQKLIPVPLGTQVCFDDWCATVVNAERQTAGDSIVIILHIEMSNNARGIAQKPSEPRVHILDVNNQARSYSVTGQQEYEKHNGTQPGIAHRLELHQSMGTVLIFTVPKTSTDLKVLIEEGPWITDLLFLADEEVFLIR